MKDVSQMNRAELEDLYNRYAARRREISEQEDREYMDWLPDTEDECRRLLARTGGHDPRRTLIRKKIYEIVVDELFPEN